MCIGSTYSENGQVSSLPIGFPVDKHCGLETKLKE